MTAPLTTLAAIVLAVCTACGSGPAQTLGVEFAVAAVPRASADPADALKAAQGMNAFGLDLYRRIASGTGNVVISPASVALALALARSGARGETAAQMDTVLRTIASDDHASWLNALDAVLASRTGTFKDRADKDASVTLRIANAAYAQRGMTIVPAFLAALATRYGTGLRLVDYRTDPEAARVAIDRWVSDHTEARIPELLAKGDLDTLTRLVLINAIYLKAAWLTPFSPELTKPGSFTKIGGVKVQVPRMAGGGTLPYAAGTGWQAVELPYVGGSLALTMIVPDDLASFEAHLDAATVNAVTGALAPRAVNLWMPKFGIETRSDLAEVLAALGMPLAFDPNRSDFSGITTQEHLVIARVVQQANIDVDEKGTTASAATAAVLEATSLPTDLVTLHIDRPFLFAVRDTQTGAILFLGRVTEPATR